MCHTLEVSRSGYYDWIARTPSNREQENNKILKLAIQSHKKSNGIYGLDKILKDVRIEFPKCSRHRLYRLQKKNHLYSIRKRKFKVTTNSNHKLPVAENLLNQEFNIETPATVWASDISYINTSEGWLYLATIKDLCTKEIVGWATDDNMKTELCKQALKAAVRRHRPPKGLIHHSDRGVQYCSQEYQELLKEHNMICSMSRKGNCYDNAPAETFFSTIKCELLYHKQYETRAQAHQDIFWYIEIFYNRQRRHQSLGYLSPVDFKKTLAPKIVA